jgi:dUTP pyrophosphatase
MNIPFRVKKLTKTAKAPHRNCESDLWDLYADDFKIFDEIDVKNNFNDHGELESSESIGKFTTIISCDGGPLCKIKPQGRILVKTGISLELPKAVKYDDEKIEYYYGDMPELKRKGVYYEFYSYAVADIRPRSGLALKHGITVLNTPGTIDNSYRKEIGVIIYNAGHEPYTISKGDKIAQMLIRPLYPSQMEIVEHIEDTGRGGYGSTGK